MADKKISELTAITLLADDDLLPVVDVSDTAMGAGGTNKSITPSNLSSYLERVVNVDYSYHVTLDPTTHVNGSLLILGNSSGGIITLPDQSVTTVQSGYTVTMITEWPNGTDLQHGAFCQIYTNNSMQNDYFYGLCELTHVGNSIWIAHPTGSSGYTNTTRFENSSSGGSSYGY